MTTEQGQGSGGGSALDRAAQGGVLPGVTDEDSVAQGTIDTDRPDTGDDDELAAGGGGDVLGADRAGSVDTDLSSRNATLGEATAHSGHPDQAEHDVVTGGRDPD